MSDTDKTLQEELDCYKSSGDRFEYSKEYMGFDDDNVLPHQYHSQIKYKKYTTNDAFHIDLNYNYFNKRSMTSTITDGTFVVEKEDGSHDYVSCSDYIESMWEDFDNKKEIKLQKFIESKKNDPHSEAQNRDEGNKELE